MDLQQSAIRTFFGKLGLEVELADIYIALHSHGPQSISALSRNAKVERTRIYRLLDRLMESNLIELETHHTRGIIKAAPITNLRILINQREEALKNLQDELGLIEQALARNSLSNPGVRVQLYHGPEGVRQMLQNELKAGTEILAYANRILEEATGKIFMDHWSGEFEARKLTIRQLVDEAYAKSQQTGRRSGIATSRKLGNSGQATVPEQLFKLRHVCHIYDQVVATYHWQDDDVYGIEIYNAGIADSQRQFFELLWERSKGGQPFIP